jgi:hypothetical protein
MTETYILTLFLFLEAKMQTVRQDFVDYVMLPNFLVFFKDFREENKKGKQKRYVGLIQIIRDNLGGGIVSHMIHGVTK